MRQNIQYKDNPKQNFGLNFKEFNNLLQDMQNGNELLFEKVFLVHFEDCVTYLIKRYKTDRPTAYDASMEALLKFRHRLQAGKIEYGNMRFLFTRMAGQKLMDSFKKHTLILNGQENELYEKPILNDTQSDALDKAWQKLCEDCLTLLENFYYKNINLKILANHLDKSEAAIRKQKQRCLEKLRSHFLEFYR